VTQSPPYGSAPTYGGLRPLGVGEILDNAIQVYRRNFRAFITMTAVAVVPIQIITVLVNLSARPSAHTPESTIGGIQFGASSTGSEAAVRLGASFVVIILSLVAARLAIGACTRGVADAYLGGAKADAGASLRVAFRSLGSLLWLELLAAPADVGVPSAASSPVCGSGSRGSSRRRCSSSRASAARTRSGGRSSS
jgi:hypothetical protein